MEIKCQRASFFCRHNQRPHYEAGTWCNYCAIHYNSICIIGFEYCTAYTTNWWRGADSCFESTKPKKNTLINSAATCETLQHMNHCLQTLHEARNLECNGVNKIVTVAHKPLGDKQSYIALIIFINKRGDQVLMTQFSKKHHNCT